MKENPKLMCFHCGVNGALLIPFLWASKAAAGIFGDSNIFAFLSIVIGGRLFPWSEMLRNDSPPPPGMKLLCSKNKNIWAFQSLLVRVEWKTFSPLITEPLTRGSPLFFSVPLWCMWVSSALKREETQSTQNGQHQFGFPPLSQERTEDLRKIHC